MPGVWLKSSPLGTYLFRRTDPTESIRTRTRKLMQMARYARAAAPGELLGWDDVDAVRFGELYEALHELSSKETSLTTLTEDL